jgi:CBS-domain-containing membrane protein
MKIKDIMSTQVISASPNTELTEVSYLIFSNRFHGIPVIDEGEKVVGIITEDDFFIKDFNSLFLPSYIKFLQEKKDGRNLSDDIKQKIEKLSRLKASDIMSENCITVSQETGIDEMMEIIKKTKFTTFPVVDSAGKIIGITTLSDILGIVKKGSREMSQALENKQAKLGKLASEISYIWDNKIELISKQKVQTWKGIAFVSVVAVIGLIIVIAVILS